MLSKEILQKKYWNERLSLKKIAQEEQVSPKTVARWMESWNIERRPFSTKGLQTRLGAILTEETKKKIAQKHLGKRLSPEHRKKVVANLNKYRWGNKNPAWTGGIVVSDNGYIGSHILLLEQKIGRYLEKDEVAHHKNEKRWDNRLENLQVMTFNKHSKYHAIKRYKANKGLNHS